MYCFECFLMQESVPFWKHPFSTKNGFNFKFVKAKKGKNMISLDSKKETFI